MARKITYYQPDMTLSKAEIAADRAAWDKLEAELSRLREAATIAVRLIDANLYHQREKVEDAADILRRALSQSTANAQLIAAAPDLYGALDEIVSAFERGDVVDGHAAIGLARAAMAKARGEST